MALAAAASALLAPADLAPIPRAGAAEGTLAPAEAPKEKKAGEAKKKDEDPIVFNARLGYDQSGIRAWDGRWNPLFLTIENRGKHPFEGRVFVRKTHADASFPATSYSLPVKLAAGTRKRFATLAFIEADESKLEVELDAGRYGHRAQAFNVVFYRPEEACVLVCADEPAGTAAALALPEMDADELGMRPQRYVYIVPTDRLPEDRAGYGDAAAVVFETGSAGEMTDIQLAALREYVHAGGTLVVAAGRHAAATAKSPLAALLPVQIAGSAAAETVDLRLTAGRTAGAAAETIGREFTGRFTVARTEPLSRPPDAGTREAPMVVQEERGLGRAVFLAFSLSELSRALRGAGDRKVADWFLRRERGLLAAPQASALPAGGFRRRGARSAGDESEDAPSDIQSGALRNDIDLGLRRKLVVRFPPVLHIAGLLGLYFACLVPINYLVWSMLRRRELAWATALVLSFGFGGAYYAWGVYGGGSVVTGEAVTVVESRSGSAAGRYWSFQSLYAPGHAEGNLRLDGAPGFACQPPLLSRLRVSHVERGIRALDYAVRWDPRCVLDRFQIYPRAVRTFESEGTCMLGGGLIVTPERDGDAVSAVRVTNRTPWTLDHVDVFLNPRILCHEKPLKTGETARIEDRAQVGSPHGPVPWIAGLLFKAEGRIPVAAYATADVLHPAYEGYTVFQRRTLALVVPAAP